MPEDRLLTTAELARALSLSERTIQRYRQSGELIPDLVSPGGHARWSLTGVRDQLRALQERDD
ncbi:MAG: helix-turn-helix domain-containing protein [Pseudonocardia sp.]|nr:helix-turn-helix domain-containing protein [Pseudonocardia sp.]